ncbi:hypothetical protein D8B24_04920, partial [Verminephrobacter aporrectodeae subsp. tuberculatae]|uniref:choice-of-anchor U domain-containing protein n=1 Tax=Verminephrobacter aporrectodeae TaxID=1110389 RepID=UPI002ADE94E9
SHDGKGSGQKDNTDAAVNTGGSTSTRAILAPDSSNQDGSHTISVHNVANNLLSATPPSSGGSNTTPADARPVAGGNSTRNPASKDAARPVGNAGSESIHKAAPDRPNPAADQPQGPATASTKSSQHSAAASAPLVVSPQDSPGSTPTTQPPLVASSQDGKDSGQADNTGAAMDTWGGMSTVSTLWPLFGSVLFRDPKPKDPIPTADQPQDKSSPGNAPTTQTTPVASSQDGSHTIGVRSVADKLLPTTTADAPDRPHPAADQPQGSGGGGGGGSSGSSSTSTKSSQRTAVASTTLVVSPQGESSPGSAPTTQTTLVAGGQDGQLSADHGTRITSLAQKDAPADLTRGLEMPIGLISFQAELAPGIRTETFSLYVDPALDVNGYWMPNQEGVWVNLASELYGGKMVLEGEQLRLDFRIEDGGRFDAGAQADGSITAAGAAARMPLSLLGYPPDSGYQTFWF